MTKFILHIGTHKTGTTAIQQFFAENRSAFLSHGIDFPEIGRIAKGSQAHRHFSAYFRGIEHEYPADFPMRIAAGVSDQPRCVISSEDFYFASQPETTAKALEFFGEETTVVCFFRDPVEHIKSLYCETVKGREGKSFQEFVDFHTDRLRQREGFCFYAYEQNIASWREAFPDTTIRRFRKSIDPSAVVREFSRAAGIDWPADVRPPRQANEAMPPPAAYLLARLNAAFTAGEISADDRVCLRRIVLTLKGHWDALVPSVVDVPIKNFHRAFVQKSPSIAALLGSETLFDETITFPHSLMSVQGLIQEICLYEDNVSLTSSPAFKAFGH